MSVAIRVESEGRDPGVSHSPCCVNLPRTSRSRDNQRYRPNGGRGSPLDPKEMIKGEGRECSSTRDQSVDPKGTAEGLTYNRQTRQTSAPHFMSFFGCCLRGKFFLFFLSPAGSPIHVSLINGIFSLGTWPAILSIFVSHSQTVAHADNK